MRVGSAHTDRSGDSEWRSEREEIDARTRLIDAEVRRTLAEAKRTEVEARRLEAERLDFEFGAFRRDVYFVIAVAIALVVFAQLLLEPGQLALGGGAGVVALLVWLAGRAEAA